VILIRVLVTAWLLALTGIPPANGYRGRALLTLAGAVGEWWKAGSREKDPGVLAAVVQAG
jgi:NADH:ubiquinone oxidoreductase subunit 2 (subunit N)